MEMQQGPSNAGKKDELSLFGIDFGKLSKVAQFFVSSTFIFILYLIYGYLQEGLFKNDGKHMLFLAKLSADIQQFANSALSFL